MKVLFITNDNSVYGANRALLTLIDELKENTCTCDVLLSRKGPIIDELNCNNINYYLYKTCPWMCNKSERRWKNICRIIFNKAAFWFISKKLKKENYDIVHTNSSVTNLGAYLSKKWKCKHVWHIREIPDAYQLEYIYPDSYVRKQYSKADKVVVISNYVLDYYKRVLNSDAKLQVVYDGVKVNISKHVDHEVFAFCIVGTITEDKGQLLVCKSVKLLLNRGINNFICYIIGGTSDSEYYKKVCAYVNDNNLDRNISMVGHTSNPAKYYEISDVGIMASNSEGFGLVTIEYMLNELLVLGANAGATPELICDGANGFLFKKNDYIDLADMMMWCIQNKDMLKQISLESRNYAMEHFSSKKNAEQILDIYKAVN